MKTLRLFLFLALLALSSHGATITFSITNNAGPSSNTVTVFPVASYANSDGSYQGVGLPLFVLMTNGFGSIVLLPGNYLATNSDLCSQYTGPGAVGTPYGVVFAVPNSSGTFPFGLLALPSSAGNYNVFNYTGATLTNGTTAAGIAAAVGFIPLSPQQVTNLFALCNTNQYGPGTNIFAVTNGVTITWEVPTQWFITNGFIHLSDLSSYATTNYANGITNGQTSIVYSNASAFTTQAQATNVSYYETTNNGVLQTNFTLYSVGTNNSALNSALQATNSALGSALAASNAVQAASLLFATNALQAGKQQSNGVLTALAGGLAWTNMSFGLIAGTNLTYVTNFSTGLVTIEVPSQWFITNSLGSMAYQSASSYLLASLLPGLTNGFLPLNGTNGLLGTNVAYATFYLNSNPSNFITAAYTNSLATTNFVLATLTASNLNFITFAQVQSSNGLAIQGGAMLGTNYANQVGLALTNLGYSIGQGCTNLAYIIGQASTNNTLSASNNILVLAGATATNYAFGLAQAGTNNLNSASNSLSLSLGGLQLRAITNFNTGLVSLTNAGNVLSGIHSGTGVGLSNILASGISNAGQLIYSNNITSNSIAGQVNISQIYGAATTNNFLTITNGMAQNQFGFGTRTNFQVTTNVIGIIGGGSTTEGTYLGINFNMTWTNYFKTNFTILASGGNYFLMSNSVTLYSTPDLVNWSIVSGATPAPLFGFFGTKWHMTGTLMDGWVISTNLQYQFLSALNAYVPTNAAASNYIASIVLALASSPTNGITSVQASNIVAQYGSILFTDTNLSNLSPAGLGVITNIANSASGDGSGGGANTNLTNISPTGTNVIAAIASGLIPASATSWNTNGNGPPAGSILGTTNVTALKLVVYGTNAVTYSTPLLNDVLINAGYDNTITPDSGTVSNRNSAILSGQSNLIAGVAFNDANDGRGDIIVGGDSNTNMSTGFGLIGTGWGNLLSSFSYESILNGFDNKVGSVSYGQVLDGINNTVTSYGGSVQGGASFGCMTIINGRQNTNSSYFGLIGGGVANQLGWGSAAGFPPSYPVILNGTGNMISNYVWFGTILNGINNKIASSSLSATLGGDTIIGGSNNVISGANSTVSGSSVNVANNNVFAFGDGSSALASTANNQFIVQATGGAEFKNTPVDTTVGYTVNGIPVSGGTTNIVTNSAASQVYVFGTNFIAPVWFFASNSAVSGIFIDTNSPVGGYAGANPIFGGLYLTATNGNLYYTNLNGMQYVTPGLTRSHTIIGSNIVTTLSAASTFPSYAGSSSGVFYGLNSFSTFSAINVLFSNISASFGQVSVNTNSAGTNTLYVQGSVSVNGDLIATNLIAPANNLSGALPSSLQSIVITNANSLADLRNSSAAFIGQLGTVVTGNGTVGRSFQIAPAASVGTNSFLGTFYFPGGVAQVGVPDADPVNGSQQPSDLGWYVNGDRTNTTIESKRFGGYFYWNNLNVFGDGSLMCFPLYTTNHTGTPVITNADGIPIYEETPFGMQIGTLNRENISGETNEAGSYVILTQPDLAFYMSVNQGVSGEAGGFFSQHYFYGFDPSLDITHFPVLKPYVWTFTNANNVDAITINHLTGAVSITNSLHLANTVLWDNPKAHLRFGPIAGNDDLTAFAVDTNAAFSANNAAFTWDFNASVHRLGVVTKQGDYPGIAYASGAQIDFSASSAGDLQATAPNSTTLSPVISLGADTNFYVRTEGFGLSGFTNASGHTLLGTTDNGSGLTSLNAANVSGIWAAPVVTNFAGSVTFSNLNVPNTTATLALLPSQVPNATQVTNMITANASGGGGSGNVLSNTAVQFTQLTVTNGQLVVSNNIPVGALDQQNTNTFAQPLVIQNLSGGASASSEVSVWADTGSSTNNFSSFGINNSGFNNSALPPVGPYTAYWLAQGNSTNWGTVATETIMIDAPQTNASINFSAGNGSTFTNAQISDSGFTLNRGLYMGNGSGITNLNATNMVGLSTNGLVFVPVQYVVGTLYTNTLSNNIVVAGVQASPTTALSAGQTSLKFQNGASSYTVFNEVTVGLIGSASGGMTNGMASQTVGPGVTYGWTDTSAGAGNSCTLATTGAGYFYVSQLVANGSQNAVVTNGTTQIVSTALQLTNSANVISGNGGGLTGVRTAVVLVGGNGTFTSFGANVAYVFPAGYTTASYTGANAIFATNFFTFPASGYLTNFRACQFNGSGASMLGTNIVHTFMTNGVFSGITNMVVLGANATVVVSAIPAGMNVQAGQSFCFYDVNTNATGAASSQGIFDEITLVETNSP